MKDNKIQAPLHDIARMIDLRCKQCGRLCWYSGYTQSQDFWGWDAEFCKACDCWVKEGKHCGNLSCQYCATRPVRPSLIRLQEHVSQWFFGSSDENAEPLSPLPNKPGQRGAALVAVQFAQRKQVVRIGMAIQDGHDWWDEFQSHLLIFATDANVRISGNCGSPVSANQAANMTILAAGAEFEIALLARGAPRCRLSFDGVHVWQVAQPEGGQRRLLLCDTDVVDARGF